jgi:hypothetical protein
MKIATLLALLGSAACIETGLSTVELNKEYDDAQDTEEKDNGLSQLMASALAGAKPGIINEPKHKGSDKEMQKTVTKG